MPATEPLRDDLFEQYFYEVNLPISTMRVAKSILNRFADFLTAQGSDISSCSKLLTMRYLKALEDEKGLSKVTVLSHLTALRRFYAWAVEGEYIDVNPTKGIKRRNTSAANAAYQPVTTEQEYAAMMRHCPKNECGRRDAAILSLLWNTGLRRSEVCKPTMGQWLDSPQRSTLIVGDADDPTKDGNSRHVPLHPATARLLRLYVYRYRKGADSSEPLFLSRSALDGHLRPNGVSHVIERARQRAGLPHKGVHSFRRAWAINACKSGMSARTIKKVAGWKDDSMLRHYIASQETELAHDEYFATMGKDKKKYQPRLRRVV